MNASLPQSARCHSPDPDTLALSGALTFANAAQVFEEAGRALREGTQTRLDLARLARSDSASVSGSGLWQRADWGKEAFIARWVGIARRLFSW